MPQTYSAHQPTIMNAACQRSLLILLAAAALVPSRTGAAEADLAWPPATRETRPWSYWWWLGSAVDATNLTRELQRYRAAGWGGVHIIPRGFRRLRRSASARDVP